MSTRTYGQYCGLAAAMDLVGQRWAMLIIRDLAPGPRRFTDLFAGLPGIATDMLAERLRALEAAGVIHQHAIKHPVPAKVYELTDSGRELSRLATELAGWGQRLLPAPGSTDAMVQPRWALQSMAARYHGGATPGVYHLVIDEQELSVEVAETAQVHYGLLPSPIASLRCTARQFFALVRQPARVHSTPKSVEIDHADQWAVLLSAMPLVVAGTALTGA